LKKHLVKGKNNTMKKFILLILFNFAITGAILNAQEKPTPKVDKKKIELKPNSREYGAVRRDNTGIRKDRPRDKAFLMKRRGEIQKMKMMRMQKKRAFKQEQIIRRRQFIQQRRALRR
jgi:hypothetical protein